MKTPETPYKPATVKLKFAKNPIITSANISVLGDSIGTNGSWQILNMSATQPTITAASNDSINIVFNTINPDWTHDGRTVIGYPTAGKLPTVARPSYHVDAATIKFVLPEAVRQELIAMPGDFLVNMLNRIELDTGIKIYNASDNFIWARESVLINGALAGKKIR
jgi:hypothetical protein